jgi:indole-3-glycerol phosphate synthase
MTQTILDRIFEAKRLRVAAAKENCDGEVLRDRAQRIRDLRTAGTFRQALLRNDSLNIIAEFKRASPSKGPINGTASIAATVEAYERGGACAISVLTEEDFFQGSLDDLAVARNKTSLAILRKDFILDEYQIWESAAIGADAVLLIASMLDDETISRLNAAAKEFGLDTLVEVHTHEELERASRLGAEIIGVNNRNLKSFDVSLDVSRGLILFAPTDAVMVAESGLRNYRDLEELRSLGYKGFLIGEALMKSGEPEQALRNLLGVTV